MANKLTETNVLVLPLRASVYFSSRGKRGWPVRHHAMVLTTQFFLVSCILFVPYDFSLHVVFCI
jgi:hypothetical protein